MRYRTGGALPAEAQSIRANGNFLAGQRYAVGTDIPLMVDCYMSLDVPQAIGRDGCAALDILVGGGFALDAEEGLFRALFD